MLFALAIIAMEHVAVVEVGEPYLREADGLSSIIIPDMYAMESDAGAMLPGTVQYFPVPPGSEIHLDWDVAATGNTGWDRHFQLASAPILSGTGLQTVETFLPVEFPTEHPPVSFEVIHLLGTTVAKVSVSPFCYGRSTVYAREINYSLSFNERSSGRSLDGTLLQELCPDAEVWWPYTRPGSVESPFWGKPWARIGVENTGVYSISGEELEASGCMVTGSPSASLGMFSGPAEMFDPEDPGDEHHLASVSISVFDGGDGIFDSSDSLVFFGQGLWHWNFTPDSIFRSYNRYDEINTYWLTWGGENGARIDQVPVVPSGGSPIEQGVVPFGFEEEVFWDSSEYRTGWVWGFLSGAFPSYFYLSAPFASDFATVRLSIVNASISTHAVWAEMENVLFLDTMGSQIFELYTVDNVSIQQGGNLLKVWNDISGDSFLNYAEILLPVNLSTSAGNLVSLSDYSPGLHSLNIGSVSSGTEIYDVTYPHDPKRLTDWIIEGSEAQLSYDMQGDVSTLLAVNPSSYLSAEFIEQAQPGRILGASSPADIIITVPEVLHEGMGVLESLYSSRGLSVSVVTYKEIYDEFAQGVSDPGAVRSLVRWALDTWPDPPQALLLIGDGSNDPLGYSTGYHSIAPVHVELKTGSCTDSYFTTVHTGGQDPEIPVSRIPASTVNDLLVASEKAVALENTSNLGPWANTVLLAADDEWGKSASSSELVNTGICEQLADSIIPASANIFKLYEIAYPWPVGTTVGGVHPTKPEASSDFVDQLNSGVVSVSFFGHGSYDQMTHEKLFSSAMVSNLTNGPRYFLYNSFSCSTGFFDLSAGDCLAEALLFHPGGGAAATVACTRLSTTGQNGFLSAEFLTRLHDGSFTIAEALWLSQLSLVGGANNYQYPILGDGGITLHTTETNGYDIEEADTLRRGLLNRVEVTFPEESSFLFRCRESADSIFFVSSIVDNCEMQYLRYGSEFYSSILSTDPVGDASVDFFVPLQADTGSLARVDATGRVGEELGTGFAWPVPLVDTGTHSDDSEGPDITLSFPSSPAGGEIPTVYQNAELHAVISDSSGICILGDDAGSTIIGSVDGSFEDLTDLFTYNHGSYTTGSLDYSLPDLLPGTHEFRLVARDGMKNTGEAVLSFNVLNGEAPLLEKTGVFPNPVRGPRAFFFTSSSIGTVSVTVFTIAGRPVWNGNTIVQSGAGQLFWNGMDKDGDSIAAGAYIYLIEFSSSSGDAAVTDVLVVSP